MLLNRVGRSLANLAGYDDSGFAVTLADSAPTDIHLYRTVTTPGSGSPLQGTWQPDARDHDPNSVLDSTSRTAFLTSFQNHGVDGRWTLFASDLESGGVSQIDSWVLNFTAVPEPQSYALAVGTGLLLLAAARRYARNRCKRRLVRL